MVSVSVMAQIAPSRPKLVVGIMVDGLNNDYLQLLRNHFGHNGFNRLLRDGVLIKDVEFGTSLDRTAATAMIYTGAAPSVNGVASTIAWDTNKRVAVPVLNDASKIGNYTDETYSPASLLASTLSDEVRIDGAGIGQVHAIAPDASQAIIMAGHAGNSAFWLNNVTGQWATTTYYKDVPSPIQNINYRSPLSTRMDTMSWTPSIPLERYPDLPQHKRYYAFRYVFPKNDRDRYTVFSTSPYINTEITDLANDYIASMALGSHEAIDMLNIAYTLQPYEGLSESDNRIETMDSYLRLDADLGRLLKVIDHRVGIGNAVIFLAGTPEKPSSKRDEPRWAIPTGEFSPRRAISLLNVYLMAVYGNGEWVQGYHDGYFYLNRKLIKERDMDLRKMRADAADFLTRMSGVNSVYTIDEIISGRAGDNANALRRNTVASKAGDILVTTNPGWETVDDTVTPVKHSINRAAATTAPVIILAPSVASKTIDTPVDARVIAPTVAGILRIRSPNAAILSPMRW